MTLREYLNGKGTEEEREAFIQWLNNQRRFGFKRKEKEKEKKNMTIKEVLDFYYSKYPTLKLCIKMWGGIMGEYRLLTREEAVARFAPWLEDTVLSVSFEEKLTKLNEIIPTPYPYLSITYVEV